MGATFIGCFKEIVKEFAGKTALCCGRRSVSYAELDAEASRVAQKLGLSGTAWRNSREAPPRRTTSQRYACR